MSDMSEGREFFVIMTFKDYKGDNATWHGTVRGTTEEEIYKQALSKAQFQTSPGVVYYRAVPNWV